MKTVLIPTEDHDSMSAVLETARLIASRFDSYMEGVAVRPSSEDFVTFEPVSSLNMSSVAESDAEIARQARNLFESFMQAHDVPLAQQEQAEYSYGWVRTAAEDDAFIGSYGRLFDVMVLGRPGRAPQNPRMSPLEAALFESGHPVLIAPPSAPQDLGRNILIAWNGSTEQARTTAFAMPLLRRASQVTVLTVDGGMTPGPASDEVAHYLRMNGIHAAAIKIAPAGRSTGEAILDHASSLGCDLLVKGAYTQSRLRQMIFGGATRHILANATGSRRHALPCVRTGRQIFRNFNHFSRPLESAKLGYCPRYMRRSGIATARKKPSVVKAAIERNAARNASAMSA